MSSPCSVCCFPRTSARSGAPLQAGWTEALPAISALATDLARTEELVAASHAVCGSMSCWPDLWDRLGEATEDLVKDTPVR